MVLLYKIFQRGGEILAGHFLELGDTDKTIARLQQFGLHALHFDDGAYQVITSVLGSSLRIIVRTILLPGLPRMRLTASFKAIPLISVSSILMMKSPLLMPAL